MARSRKTAAKGTSRARKLAVKKERVEPRAGAGARPVLGGFVIDTKAVRGMVIDRSALFKRGK